ncbi:MAG: ATP-binding protein [Planctomycetota bacterium]|nr:ATP-binding protein [Planctomycetota bacterium]
MGYINVAERTINAKLVYYGVGVGGKTTSLQRVHGILCPRNEVELVSINTEEDSTLLFDFLPINLGSVGSFKIRIQGFTVPGQPKYRAMRKYVLAGADAVVFVVDSQQSRLQENVESLQSMREHLAEAMAEDIPVIVQYNKRDLSDILTEQELDEHFKFRSDVVTFPSVATEGLGVFEAFVHAAGELVATKVHQYQPGREDDPAEDVAEGVRKKLWEICDQVRHEHAEVDAETQPQARLTVADSGAAAGAGEAAEDETGRLANGSGEVITDAELDADLLPLHDGPPGATRALAEENLLDSSVQSNLELVQRYGQLDEHRNLLERKVRELVEVAQNTVHDLNRPVSAVRLMLSTLDKGYLGELEEPVRQAVSNGLLAVQQMELLIRDLLDSSRLDHDGFDLEFVEVDLTMLWAHIVNTQRYELEERNAHIRVEPMPIILADEWALNKAFSNLLANALQYVDEERQLVVRIWVDDADDEWRIHVRDNGIGIPAADRERLFRRFERGSNTAGRTGSGLGLHIIKEIAAGHGGRVTIDSTEGVGTTVTVHMPKQPVQPEHSPVSETAECADL